MIEAVGRGGFGTVYRADLLGPGGFRKAVALKVLNPDIAEQHDFAERLRDEARMLGLLRHRAVVAVDGLLLLNGRWTVVMEYVEGVDLKAIGALGPVPVAPCLEIVQEVAGALASAFDSTGPDGQPLHLLHRDVKPSNIQLTATGEVKILDFGVARAEFQHRESVTRSIFFGSLGYMAPERLDGIDTHAGDMYALGAVLYELLTGAPLGRTSGNRERHNAHLEAAIERLRESVDDAELIQLAGDCLAYDDGARPRARDLERRIRSLRMRYSEPWLKDYAEAVVPRLLAERGTIDDELSGSILVEQAEVSGTFPPDQTGEEPAHLDPDAGASGLWLGVIAAIVAATLVIVLGGGAMMGLVISLRQDESSVVSAPGTDDAIDALAEDDADALALAEDPYPTPVDDPPASPTTAEPAPASPSHSATASSARPPRTAGTTPSAEPATTREAPASARVVEVAPASADDDEVPVAWPPADAAPASGTADAPDAGPRGTVLITGDGKNARLVKAGVSYRPGVLATGTYDIFVSFDGISDVHAGTVDVAEGKRVVLVCRAGLQRCARR